MQIQQCFSLIFKYFFFGSQKLINYAIVLQKKKSLIHLLALNQFFGLFRVPETSLKHQVKCSIFFLCLAIPFLKIAMLDKVSTMYI